MKRYNIKQYVIMTAIFLWGFASFIVLAGEDAPFDEPTPIGKLFLIKGIALLSLAASIAVGMYLEHKGYLPQPKEE